MKAALREESDTEAKTVLSDGQTMSTEKIRRSRLQKAKKFFALKKKKIRNIVPRKLFLCCIDAPDTSTQDSTRREEFTEGAKLSMNNLGILLEADTLTSFKEGEAKFEKPPKVCNLYKNSRKTSSLQDEFVYPTRQAPAREPHEKRKLWQCVLRCFGSF
jgi:hypothetical protein